VRASHRSPSHVDHDDDTYVQAGGGSTAMGGCDRAVAAFGPAPVNTLLSNNDTNVVAYLRHDARLQQGVLGIAVQCPHVAGEHRQLPRHKAATTYILRRNRHKYVLAWRNGTQWRHSLECKGLFVQCAVTSVSKQHGVHLEAIHDLSRLPVPITLLDHHVVSHPHANIAG